MGCVHSSLSSDSREVKFSKQYCRIVKRYLPHFEFQEPSNEQDRLTAFAHWESTYKDTIHSEKTGADSPVGRLYAAFYKYLFDNAAQLKPLFQASHAIQSRVLTHISTGMKSLLSSEDLVQKVMHLALVHMKIGVKPDDFDPLGEALIQAMKQTTGAAWDERTETAWRRIYCHAAILILVNIPNVHLDLDDFKDEKQAPNVLATSVAAGTGTRNPNAQNRSERFDSGDSSGVATHELNLQLMRAALSGGCTWRGCPHQIRMATTLGVAVTSTVALVGVVIGGAAVVSHHLFHSGQHESLSASDPAPRRPRRPWLIATEEGKGNVRVCRYGSEAAARAAFDKIWCARILYNPRHEEITQAGLGLSSHANIRHAMREGYFMRPPSPTLRALQRVMEVAIPIAATVLPLVV